MTIVGNPGEGKTSLMHYLFIQTQEEDKLFPIMLDYRLCAPRKKETLIINFVKEMKRYLKHIKRPLHQISEETHSHNYDTHHRIIMDHLRQTKMEHYNKSKKMVIFLDDLDYYEGDYLSLLKEYFLPFALNPKTVLIFSGRKPLLNTISEDNELRHAFNLNPRKIHLVRVDLKTLFQHRLSSLFPEKDEKTIFKLLNAFRKPIDISRILRAEALKYLEREAGAKDLQEDSLKIVFGFNNLFWTHLGDVTGRNFRQIEVTLPELCDFHWSRNGATFNFNTDFPSSYISSLYNEPNYLLDLVSLKTKNKKSKLNGNSIYQIILEYLYSDTLIDSTFYQNMNNFGIKQDEANETIRRLSQAPYALIDPDYVYDDQQIFRQYKINRKGKFYLDYIIENPLYYEKLFERYKSREYDFRDASGIKEITRSARRIILDRR
jgi:hypothetical protein